MVMPARRPAAAQHTANAASSGVIVRHGITSSFVHVGGAGDDRLGAADDDAVRATLGDVQIDVAIDLRARPLGAVALGVGHRTADRQVRVLDAMEIGEQPVVIGGAVVRVGAPGRLEQGVEHVGARYSAARSPDSAAHQPHRLELAQQVGRGLVDVQHAVDDLADVAWRAVISAACSGTCAKS